MSYVETMPVVVTDHAMWRAAERFPGFDTVLIEDEVRAGIKARRISTDRRLAGLSAGWGSPEDRFVWTEDGERIYAVRFRQRAVVVTTMRRTR